MGTRSIKLLVPGYYTRPFSPETAGNFPLVPVLRIGGARRDRTADPLHAMQVLSQLSYGPKTKRANLRQAPFTVNTESEL